MRKLLCAILSLFGVAILLGTCAVNASELFTNTTIHRSETYFGSSGGTASSGTIDNSRKITNDYGSKIEVVKDYVVGEGCPIDKALDSLKYVSSTSNATITVTGHQIIYQDEEPKKEDRIFYDYKYKSPYGYSIHSYMCKQFFSLGRNNWLESISSHVDYSDYSFVELEKTQWEGVVDISKAIEYTDIYYYDKELYNAIKESGCSEVPFIVKFKNLKALQERFEAMGSDQGNSFASPSPIADITLDMLGKKYEMPDVKIRSMSFNSKMGYLGFDVDSGKAATGFAFYFGIYDENSVVTSGKAPKITPVGNKASISKSKNTDSDKKSQIVVSAPDGYVNMRVGAGTKYDIMTEITNGTVLDVIDSAKNGENGKIWYKIKYVKGGKTLEGWVASSQVKDATTDVKVDSKSNNTNKEYVVDGSDTGYFEKSYFETLSDEELRLARNEIFARHGRKFKDESLQSYFYSKSWYVPKYSPEEFDAQMDSILNDWEKENVKTIQKIEAERKG